jgi:hypothetical protein
MIVNDIDVLFCRGGVVVRRKADAPPPPEVDLRAADKTKLLTRWELENVKRLEGYVFLRLFVSPPPQ